MVTIRVEIDEDEVLEQCSVEDLQNEIDRRHKPKKFSNPANYKIPIEAAIDTLDDAARIFRKMNRQDLAFKLDEIKMDYLYD